MRHIFFILLFASIAHAETIPPGCYVATGQTECYVPLDSQIGFYTRNILPADQEVNYYGQVVGSLLAGYFEQQSQIELQKLEIKKLRRRVKK